MNFLGDSQTTSCHIDADVTSPSNGYYLNDVDNYIFYFILFQKHERKHK